MSQFPDLDGKMPMWLIHRTAGQGKRHLRPLLDQYGASNPYDKVCPHLIAFHLTGNPGIVSASESLVDNKAKGSLLGRRMREKKVNLFFIGAMRCGSTTINLLLGQHPEIFMSPIKEPRYFEAELLRRRLQQSPEDRQLRDALIQFESGGRHRTATTYADLFRQAGNEAFVGESSHYIYAPDTAQLIKSYSPDARILISLREPANRLFSEHQYLVRCGRMEASFSEFVNASLRQHAGSIVEHEGSRVNKGLYAERIQHFVRVFGQKRVKVIFFEDLQRDSLKTIRSVFQWLELETHVPIREIHTQKSGKLMDVPLLTGLIESQGILKRLAKVIPKFGREKIREVLYRQMVKPAPIDEDSMQLLRAFYREDRQRLSDRYPLPASWNSGHMTEQLSNDCAQTLASDNR